MNNATNNHNPLASFFLPYELVLAGHTACHKYGSVPSLQVPSKTRRFPARWMLSGAVDSYRRNGRLVEEGRTAGNTSHILVRNRGLELQPFTYLIDPNFINHFGKLELAIFDIRTLIDDRYVDYEATMRLLERYGKPRVKFENFLEKARNSPHLFLQSQGVSQYEPQINHLYSSFYTDAIKDRIRPFLYPDAIPVLQHLTQRGINIILLGNNLPQELQQEAASWGVLDYAAALKEYTNHQDRDLVWLCSTAGKKPYNALLVGVLDNDVKVAQSAGIHSAAVAGLYHKEETLKAAKPEFLLHSLRDLTLFVEESFDQTVHHN